MTHTAVVILNYNGEKLLQQFLPAVVLYSPNAEIIVIDNSSSDHSLSILQRDFPTIRIIALAENLGFCGGYNQGLKQIDADYYVLLNSDVEVTENWLTPIIDLLDNDPSVAAVQPKILSYTQKNLFEYAGAGGGFIDSLGYPFCRGRILNQVEEDLGQYNDIKQIFWATGACLFIRSNIYHKFNGFDEDFFAHMEEIDLCWKINRTEKKVMYCGASTVFHKGAGTLSYGSSKKTYLNFKNGLSLIHKHFNNTEILYKLPIRVMLDWAASVMFLFQGKPSHFTAVIKAHIDFLWGFKNSYRKRQIVHKHYPIYDRSFIYPGSIIIDYFLERKRIIPKGSKVPDRVTLP